MFIVGCGPIYDTQYTYLAPESPEGRTCVYQCENSKFQCEQLQDMRKEQCEDRADWQYERCKARKKDKDCYREYCSADYTRCESQYRSCYQACGGTINAEQVCVAFCP